MYAKVFSQIYDGTLCTEGPWQALVTFQQMLVLADQEGQVDMTAGAIARRTTIPLEIIQLGIDKLLQPDPESRTPAEEGRRLVPLSDGRAWGWRVVNYKHYRDLKREEDRREYHRAYWHKRKGKLNDSTQTQQPQPNQPIAEAEAEALKEPRSTLVLVETAAPPSTAYRRPPCPSQEIVGLYHDALPALARVDILSDGRKRAVSARWAQVCGDAKYDRKQGLDWFAWFFGHVGKSAFLTGRVKGRSGDTFRCTFDFLMTPEKFVRVIENFYHKDTA